MTNLLPLRADDPSHVGAYELLGRIGEGGQGSVFLGASSTGGRVAVKLLRQGPGGGEEQAGTAPGSLLREIEILRRVAPFCTAQVIETGTLGAQPYIVSEYIEGPTLQQVVDIEGPLREARLRRLAVGTMTALSAIHRAGVVHRDFKPSNVLLGRDGPRVIDFGIARAMDTSVTGSGVVGTPPYMAPEQLESALVGPPADLFAWGSTMVFAATGKPPFGTDSLPAIVNRILHRDPDLGDLDGDLRDLVEECLSKDPGRRPSAKEALLRLLGARERRLDGDLLTAGTAVASGVSGTAGAAGVVEGATVPADPHARRRRRRARLAGVAAAVALLSGGAVYAMVGGGSTSRRPEASGTPTPVAVREVTDAPAAPAKEIRLPEVKARLHESPGDPVRVTSFMHLRTDVSSSYARDAKSGDFQSVGPFQEPFVSPDGAWTGILPWVKANTPGPYDSVRLIKRATGQEFMVRTVSKPLTNYYPFWSADSRRVLLTTYDESSGTRQAVGFVIVDVATAKATIVSVDTGGIGAFPFMWAPGESTVAVRFPGGSGAGLRFFDLSGKTVRTIPAVGEPSNGENTFSPAGKQFATTCPDRVASVCLWDTATGRRQATLPAPALNRLVGWYNDAHLILIDRTRDPRRVVVVNTKGKVVRVLADIPAGELEGAGEHFIPRYTRG
ncbi:protein kinase [Streptosporangium sp. NPDC000396]|uniref:protein kinase domain-containing protein n=1 Tax=Streptosporangium sp. NPDC000396 TaxID=3366185 RepID=UPI0036C27722